MQAAIRRLSIILRFIVVRDEATWSRVEGGELSQPGHFIFVQGEERKRDEFRYPRPIYRRLSTFNGRRRGVEGFEYLFPRVIQCRRIKFRIMRRELDNLFPLFNSTFNFRRCRDEIIFQFSSPTKILILHWIHSFLLISCPLLCQLNIIFENKWSIFFFSINIQSFVRFNVI